MTHIWILISEFITVTCNTDVHLINRHFRIKIMNPILPWGVHQSSGNHCQTFYHSVRSTDSHVPSLQDNYTDFSICLCQASPHKLSYDLGWSGQVVWLTNFSYLYLLIGGKNGKFPLQTQTAVSDWSGNSNKQRMF